MLKPLYPFDRTACILVSTALIAFLLTCMKIGTMTLLKLLTSRPKARDGHRYPCPALVFHDGSCFVSRAAPLEGTEGDEVL